MRVKLNFICLILALTFWSTCSAENEIIVDIDETGHDQYHIANFQNSAYQYGYDIGPNGQFHHETKGPDGVTYGCYGYIDPDGKLQVTHYVADSNGYRVVEPNQPTTVFARTINEFDDALNSDNAVEFVRMLRNWDDLYFPKGCGRTEGGVPANKPTKPPTQGHSLSSYNSWSSSHLSNSYN
ncbi:cuticle protein 16.8-like [Culicoides brevitarsis]|uniref:cuticle protein 16.8-like n=1 Tax=Culicoides brevitarsis TaxID=469753 RepID=UPI00307BE1F6